MASSRRSEPHILVIHEQGEDYDIEHLDGCPQETFWLDPEGEPIKGHTCLVGVLVNDGGLDYLDNAPEESWRNLPTGRYVIEGWTDHTPSLPTNGGEEWDAGLTLVASSVEF